MSGILKVGGSELINDNGGSGALQWGSGVPAGSVLQVVQNEITDYNALNTTYTNIYEVSIQLKSSSSDVYAFFLFSYYVGASGGFGVEIYRNNSSTVTTSHTQIWSKNAVSGGNPYTWHGVAGEGIWGSGSINPKDSLSGFSAGDTLYYGLFARAYDAGNAHVNSSDGGFISSTLMEVQK